MIPPVLVLDSREWLRPVPVETGTLVPNAAVVMKDGSRVPYTNLGLLTADAVAIDFPPNPERWAPEVQKGQPLVGYRRQVQDGGQLWDQFWTNWPDNPKAYAGEGRHEGDWEMVQIGYGLGGVPICMTGSQHRSGASRWWHDVTLDDNGAPVVFVARDSHANYFAPVDSIIDRADGKGVRAVLEWREFGPWAMWPGRWGHSESSPKSPGRQGDRWHQPALYHSRTRPA
jgi:hypothetical protein